LAAAPDAGRSGAGTPCWRFGGSSSLIRFFAAYARAPRLPSTALDALSQLAFEDDSSVAGFGFVAEEAHEAIEAILSDEA
jgi:hypothetical protein